MFEHLSIHLTLSISLCAVSTFVYVCLMIAALGSFFQKLFLTYISFVFKAKYRQFCASCDVLHTIWTILRELLTFQIDSQLYCITCFSILRHTCIHIGVGFATRCLLKVAFLLSNLSDNSLYRSIKRWVHVHCREVSLMEKGIL